MVKSLNFYNIYGLQKCGHNAMTFWMWFSFSEQEIQLDQNGMIASSLNPLMSHFNEGLFVPSSLSHQGV